MSYCLVEDNKVTDGPKTLPKSWRNVSGLHLASDEELKEKGWLPFTQQAVSLSKYEVKDGGLEYTIKSDGVVGVEQKRTMTKAEKEIHDENVVNEYKTARQIEYGTLEDQLDMMYHSMDDWKSHVKAVKDKFPKP